MFKSIALAAVAATVTATSAAAYNDRTWIRHAETELNAAQEVMDALDQARQLTFQANQLEMDVWDVESRESPIFGLLASIALTMEDFRELQTQFYADYPEARAAGIQGTIDALECPVNAWKANPINDRFGNDVSFMQTVPFWSTYGGC